MSTQTGSIRYNGSVEFVRWGQIADDIERKENDTTDESSADNEYIHGLELPPEIDSICCPIKKTLLVWPVELACCHSIVDLFNLKDFLFKTLKEKYLHSNKFSRNTIIPCPRCVKELQGITWGVSKKTRVAKVYKFIEQNKKLEGIQRKIWYQYQKSWFPQKIKKSTNQDAFPVPPKPRNPGVLDLLIYQTTLSIIQPTPLPDLENFRKLPWVGKKIEEKIFGSFQPFDNLIQRVKIVSIFLYYKDYADKLKISLPEEKDISISQKKETYTIKVELGDLKPIFLTLNQKTNLLKRH